MLGHPVHGEPSFVLPSQLSRPLVMFSIAVVSAIIGVGIYRRGVYAGIVMMLLAFPAMAYRAYRLEAILDDELQGRLWTGYALDSVLGSATLIPIGAVLALLGFALVALFHRFLRQQ